MYFCVYFLLTFSNIWPYSGELKQRLCLWLCIGVYWARHDIFPNCTSLGPEEFIYLITCVMLTPSGEGPKKKFRIPHINPFQLCQASHLCLYLKVMDASLCLSGNLLGYCYHISLPVPYNLTREDMGSIQQTKKNCTDQAQVWGWLFMFTIRC